MQLDRQSLETSSSKGYRERVQESRDRCLRSRRPEVLPRTESDSDETEAPTGAMTDEAILSLLISDTEDDFSGFSADSDAE